MMMCLPGKRGRRSVLPRTDDVSCVWYASPQLLKVGWEHAVRVDNASLPPFWRLGRIMEVSPPHAPCVVDVHKGQLEEHEHLTA